MGERTPQETARSSAKRRNNKAARKYPLWTAAGALEEVATIATPEHILAQRERCRAEGRERWERWQIEWREKAARYRAELQALVGEDEIARLQAHFDRVRYPADYAAGYWGDNLRRVLRELNPAPPAPPPAPTKPQQTTLEI